LAGKRISIQSIKYANLFIKREKIDTICATCCSNCLKSYLVECSLIGAKFLRVWLELPIISHIIFAVLGVYHTLVDYKMSAILTFIDINIDNFISKNI